jgi:LAO/AO transport system kinase
VTAAVAPLADLADGICAGDQRAVARALTLVETGSAHLSALLDRLPPTREPELIGVTGPPGVGKSTLVNRLVTVYRGHGRRVAVLAVDPSSPTGRGALLGDRLRMAEHVGDDGVFVRSLAARGHLGGLAAAVPPSLRVLDAAGFDVVLLETVGVGQSEVEVAAMVDTTVVTVAPGLGDDVQADKAGVLEIADVLVVNRADADGAARTANQLRQALHLGAVPADDDWPVPVLLTSALSGEGVDELVAAVARHTAWARARERPVGQRDLGRAVLAHVERWLASAPGQAALRAAGDHPDVDAAVAHVVTVLSETPGMKEET